MRPQGWGQERAVDAVWLTLHFFIEYFALHKATLSWTSEKEE